MSERAPGDAPQLGDLRNAQRYSAEEIARIGLEAAPHVTGTKDAGKVYCPFCKLREARWKRHLDPHAPRSIRLFVYCTQCHKTGVTTVELGSPGAGAMGRSRPIGRLALWIVVLLIVALWLAN